MPKQPEPSVDHLGVPRGGAPKPTADKPAAPKADALEKRDQHPFGEIIDADPTPLKY